MFRGVRGAVFGLIAAAFAVGGCNCDYSSGERAGVVTKFSQKGLLCKTWEGEMLLGGTRLDAEGNAVANTWQFTVKSDDAASREAIEAALQSGQRVAISYHQVLAATPCTTDSGYWATGVKAKE